MRRSLRRGLYVVVSLVLLSFCLGPAVNGTVYSKSIPEDNKHDEKETQVLKLVNEMRKRYKGNNPLMSAFLTTAQRYAKGFPEGMSGMDRIFLNSLKLSKTSEDLIKSIVNNFNSLPPEIKEMTIKQDMEKGYQGDSLYEEYMLFTKNVFTGSAQVYTDKERSISSLKCKGTLSKTPPRIHRILPPHGIEPETWLVEPSSRVRLMGKHFKEKARVFIHPFKLKELIVYSPEVKIISDSEIEFRVPEGLTHLPDMYRVVVVNPDGSCSEEEDDLIEILPFRYSIISRLETPDDSTPHLIYTISDGTGVYAKNIRTHDETLVSHYRPKNGILYLRLIDFEKKTEIIDNPIINMVLAFVSPVVACMSKDWEEIERKPLCAISGVEAVSDLIILLNILSGNRYIGSFSEFYNVSSLEELKDTRKKITISDMEVYLNFERHPLNQDHQ